MTIYHICCNNILKFCINNKIILTLCYGLTLVVITLLSSIFITDQSIAATSTKPFKTGFGWQYDYDTRGRIASITNPANKKTKFRYTQNNKGRLSAMTKELPSGSKVKFKFDKKGRRTEMIDVAGTVRYAYNKFGYLTKVHREGTSAISYGYDTLGRIKSINIGAKYKLQYVYDFRGRSEKIITPVGNILFSYNSKTGEVVRRLPNGISTRWSSRPDGSLGSINHTSASNRPLAQYQYTYRLDGLITSIKELTPLGVHKQQYKYDTAKRLVLASGSGFPNVKFAYDKLGNRTMFHLQNHNPIYAKYSWVGQLVSYDGQLCQHDPAGNLTLRSGSSKSFTFDDTGLLKTVSIKQANINYHYDGDGYLVNCNRGSGKQTFLPNPLLEMWQPLVVKNSEGEETFYIWDGALPLMAITGKQVRYFMHDHLGSVRLVIDKYGNIIKRINYMPYGQPEKMADMDALQPGFAGLFFDKTSSLYLTRARAYDPALGRFLQADPEHRIPMGSQKDLSVYAYCGGDPVNFVDINGASSMPVMISDGLGNAQLSSFSYMPNIYDVHIDRNMNMIQPIGELIPLGNSSTYYDYNKSRNNMYADKTGRAWELVPPDLSKMHDVDGYNTFKFTSYDGSSGSHEAILAIPKDNNRQNFYEDAMWINEGPSQATYNRVHNYGHPWTNIKNLNFPALKSNWGHFVQDMVPHEMPGGKDYTIYTPNRAYGSIGMDKYVPANMADLVPRIAVVEVIGSPIDYSGFNQSNVGGIRLTGAGNSLSHLGGLEGIALDKTNDRLILIGKGKRPVNLPPLRLDDVVTVFRSVYLHGEAPSVSIDPISNKKSEKFMTVRHGAATENTYVGWVLYEADRIMKTYQLGKDNRTKKKVYSRVPAYRDFYKTSIASRKGNWERFWIVPSGLNRTQGATSELTIFDVPLKVETERMEWQGGKLVTAKNPTPSKPAKAFQKWFTSQYNNIAKEVCLDPPKHSRIKGPVAVFEELRRIALITGIAETLRDQNIPFPAWMKDYPVKPCIADSQTPILRVKKQQIKLTGGVRLAAADENVHTIKGDQKVTQLARLTQSKVAAKSLFSPVSFNHDGETYNAVTLPGAGTQRSGANILLHADLTAPVLQESGINLTRHFNSFYEPRGMFGRGWTLDFPKLEPQLQPVNRTGNSISYKTVYQLSSPLNSWSERFAEIKFVSEVGGQLMVPSSSNEMLGLADSNIDKIGQKTKKLIFRDGRSLHFDQEGYLVAQSDKKNMIVYKRNKKHRIISIKSWNFQNKISLANKPDVEVNLVYNDNGKLVRSIEARSLKLEKPVKAHYFYDKGGQLVMVIGSDRKSGYTYKNGLVASVTQDGKKQGLFEYNDQGQLMKEQRADGKNVAYKRTSTSYGTKVVAMDANNQKPLETVEYDTNFRPQARTLEDGSRVTWKSDHKAKVTNVTQPDGEGYTVAESNDGRNRTVKTTDGKTYITDFDTKGRVTRAHLEGGSTLNQKWHSDGRLQSAITDEQGILPSYTSKGKLSSIVVAPPDQVQKQQIRQYVKTEYDSNGKVIKVTDNSGSQLRVDYDKTGQPSVISSQRGSVTIDRDTKGNVREVGTTWGFTKKYDYDKKSGNISMITLQQQHAGTSPEQASIELTNGRISKIRQLNGGETILNYYQKGKQKGLLKKVQTSNKLTLSYNYDNSAHLTSIDIGDSNATSYQVNYKYDIKGRLAGISYNSTFSR